MNKQQLASNIWESANRVRSKTEANGYNLAGLAELQSLLRGENDA